MVYAQTLDYERLEEPYLGWARIATKLAEGVLGPLDNLLLHFAS